MNATGGMKTYRPYQPNQMLLLPPNLREWLPEGHLSHFVSDVVDTLDLSEIRAVYEKEMRGHPPYDPEMMTKVLVYGYCVGVRSSRRIERACEEGVAFRVLSAGNRPAHRTIAEFRRRHLEALSRLFVQVLKLCRKAGLVKLGHVAIDGTKIRANASKHKAMSYERMATEEKRLAGEVEAILAEAEGIDREEDKRYGKSRRGDELPEDLTRAETRLRKIREAKAALEAEARAQGRETPRPKVQRNFTDPESRIMVDGDKAFIQGYNAQAAVDASSQVIVAAEVSQSAPDAGHLVPMIEKVKETTGRRPQEVSADAGYWSEANVEGAKRRRVEPFIAPERRRHGRRLQAPRGRMPMNLSAKGRMRRLLSTRRGRARYRLRMTTVEPVFGQIKEIGGFRRFLLRGIEKVRGEWSLACLAHNVWKLFRALRPAPA